MTEIHKLIQENKLSYGIQVETDKGNKFVIPVIDVRDGKVERARVNQMQRSVNYQKGSSYLRPSYGAGGGCYQVSHKKD